MVVIYVELSKPNETFWFKNPIRGSTISLLSCSFINEMCNLPVEGMFTVDSKVWLHVPKGNYDASSLKHLIENAEHEVGGAITVPPIRITFNNGIPSITSTKNVIMSDILVKLLNVKGGNVSLMKNTPKEINIIQPARSVLVHCDLIDFTKVTFNNEYQQLLSFVDAGDCGSMVRVPTNVVRTPMKNADYVSSMVLWITDTKGDVITEGLYPMVIAIEIT